MSLLSETLASENIVDRGHQEMDRRERPPLAKIPCHESNIINGASIRGLSINLWRVAGHLQIPFRDTWWICAQCAKNVKMALVGVKFIVPY